ncbi:hypothetical protein HZB60_00930 [candidate division KSB1 bacterium]|nr:hypothetical protein [candidate division KSB1 bacterium]
MAKAKRKPSALNELLTTIRRLMVCTVAAIGLFREVPYDILVIRLVVLAACLYLISSMTELIFQYLSYRAQATAPTGVIPAATGNPAKHELSQVE